MTNITIESLNKEIEKLNLLKEIPASQRANYAREEAKIRKNDTAVITRPDGSQQTYACTSYGKMMDVISPVISKWGIGLDTVHEGISSSNPHIYEVRMVLYDTLTSYKAIEERVPIASMYACGHIEEGTDTKGLGSVQSYVRKYCLSSFFPMGSEADLDQTGKTEKDFCSVKSVKTSTVVQQTPTTAAPVQTKPKASAGAKMFLAFIKGKSKEEMESIKPILSSVCANPTKWRVAMTEEEAQAIIDQVSKSQKPVEKSSDAPDSKSDVTPKPTKSEETTKSEGAKKLIHWMKHERRMTKVEMNEIKIFIDTIAPVHASQWKEKLTIAEADEIIAEYEQMMNANIEGDLPEGLENMMIEIGPEVDLTA